MYLLSFSQLLLASLLLSTFLPVLATLLLLPSPYFPDFSCIAVVPAISVALSAVNVEFLAVAGVSALTAAPTAVDISTATGVTTFLAFLLLLSFLLLLVYLLLPGITFLTSLLLLVYSDVPDVSCAAVGHAVAVLLLLFFCPWGLCWLESLLLLT